MSKSTESAGPPLAPTESVTVFEVDADGTLRVANFTEATTRAEFYDSVVGLWSRSPKDLADDMDACQPLAMAVHSIYSEYRDELEAKVLDARSASSSNHAELANLTARFEALTEEPEDGAVDWLLGLTSNEFEGRVVPKIEQWFSESPDWDSEEEHLPKESTAQGVALLFFSDLAEEELEAIGVDMIEGEHPGSSYYAAELSGDIHEANRAAEAAGIRVRFVAVKD